VNVRSPVPAARPVGELQRLQQHDEFRRALRALLLRPLMSPQHPEFAAVRRQAEVTAYLRVPGVTARRDPFRRCRA
jgi:hypothetical protein